MPCTICQRVNPKSRLACEQVGELDDETELDDAAVVVPVHASTYPIHRERGETLTVHMVVEQERASGGPAPGRHHKAACNPVGDRTPVHKLQVPMGSFAAVVSWPVGDPQSRHRPPDLQDWSKTM